MVESLVAVRDRRDQVIARISDAYAHDLFDVDELDRRLDLAHKVLTVAELDALVADLTASTALVVQPSVALDDPGRPQTKSLRVIMSSVERRGAWIVPKQLTARVFWGNAELDFREASLGAGVTTIDVRVTMGNLEIILPPSLAIDVDVSSFMGNVESRHRAPAQVDPSRPLLRVTGSVVMGNIEVITRLPGESRRDTSKRERRERRERREQRRLARAERKALR
ncbi:MAG TPA: LiaF domain-containing protein [Kofleriaceae bacterium]|jgi:hypothetical protein|nr:LiaF domain-containing protein [Kofleriaceae bacterium]